MCISTTAANSSVRSMSMLQALVKPWGKTTWTATLDDVCKHFYTHKKSRDWMLQLKWVLLFNQHFMFEFLSCQKKCLFDLNFEFERKLGAKSSLTAMNTNVGLLWRNVEVWRRWASGWLTNISKDDTFWNVYWMLFNERLLRYLPLPGGKYRRESFCPCQSLEQLWLS